ncbi:MAG: ATP-grasp domain-containing protein [Nitrososphaera sp.]
MPKVLVLDAAERSALTVIRSLGRAGVDVVGGNDYKFCVGLLSKYCKETLIYPSPMVSSNRFVETIIKFLSSKQIDVLFPVTDFTMEPLSKNKDRIEKFTSLAAPDYDTLQKALDKGITIREAQSVGVPVPNTHFVSSEEELVEVSRYISYPAVIKPRRGIFWVEDKAVRLKVTEQNYASSPQELISRFASLTKEYTFLRSPENFPLIQEYANGNGYGVEALIHNGECKLRFVHKRLREYPVTGGASTLRESTTNQVLEQYALALLKKIKWQGVAMVEFKYDELSERACLMEINGRFWGSLALSVAAGCDFPLMQYKTLIGKEINPPLRYKSGIKKRWLIPGDFLWLYASARRRGWVRSLKEFLGTGLISDDILSLSDMRPSLGAIVESIRLFSEVIRGQRNMSGEVLEGVQSERSSNEMPNARGHLRRD